MTTDKKSTMYAEIKKHGDNLNAIFNTGIDPYILCKKLFSWERRANKIAEQYCNGYIQTNDIDKHVAPILKAVTNILGNKYPIQFNSDCRGYSLKISDKIVKDNNLKIYTDWGGYGIIAPDFTPNN